jgi:hypothetical protein
LPRQGQSAAAGRRRALRKISPHLKNAGETSTTGIVRITAVRLAASLSVLVAGPATAQVGTGWVQYEPGSAIHLDGANGIESYPGNSTSLRNEGASFTNEGGIETFALHDPISNRSERRIQNTYLTGKRQFEGEVRVSPPTNDESVQQVFGGNSGATTQMIRAYDEGGGSLKKVPGSVLLIDKIHGVWVKVNVIHDLPANQVRTYINGKLITTGDGEAVNAGTDGWYHKYGCYGTLKTGSAKVEWRNVKHFRDGDSPAGDASAPEAGGEPDDAGSEAGTRDSGAGGAGGAGAGGTGAAPGTGGAGAGGSGVASGGAPAGAGGRVGTGGARAATGGSTGASGGAAAPAGAGGGCALGGGRDAGGAAGIAGLLAAFGWSRRRRGR